MVFSSLIESESNFKVLEFYADRHNPWYLGYTDGGNNLVFQAFGVLFLKPKTKGSKLTAILGNWQHSKI